MAEIQQRTPWWFTEFVETDRDRLMRAFDSRRFSLGVVTAELEAALGQFLDVPYVVATASGTAALTVALIAAGVRPGDEVIVPDLTWIATAQAAVAAGGTVVPVDSLADSPVLDPTDVARCVTNRTRAIVPVHFNGRTCDMDALRQIVNGRDIVIVEDACKALGSVARGRALGTIGDVGCFSLGLVSFISAGYGGFAVTHDPTTAQRMRLVRDHGVARTGPNESLALPGFNFKISDLLSSLALGHLSRADAKRERLVAIHQRYADGLRGIADVEFMSVGVESGELPLLAEIRSKRREPIVDYLMRHGVETSRFHPPVHTASYLGDPGPDERFPHATRYAAEGVILPCGPSQSLEQVDRVIALLRGFSTSEDSPVRVRR